MYGMLGFARKLLYRAAAALERRRDDNYYFIGFETKIDHMRTWDFLLRALDKKSPGTELKFWKLIDEAAGMDEPDPAVFRLGAAVSGAGLFDGISDEGREYLLGKAYARGMSLRKTRKLKRELSSLGAASILRNSFNSLYSFAGVLPSGRAVSSLSNGSVFFDEDGKLKVKAGPGLVCDIGAV